MLNLTFFSNPVADRRLRSKWHTNYYRPIERQVVGKDGKASQPEKDKHRYNYKEFSEFKKQIELKNGFRMYSAKKPSQQEDKTDVDKEPEKKKKKQKKKKPKAEPSGRSTRKITQGPIISRKMNDSRKEILRLKKAHPVVTLNVGDLYANIQRATSDNFLRERIMGSIQALVTVLNLAKRHAQMATDIFIMYIMERFPFRDYLCNMARRQCFTCLIYGSDGGKVYQQNLLRRIISGKYQEVDIDMLIAKIIDPNHGNMTKTALAPIVADCAYRLLLDGWNTDSSTFQNLDQQYGKITLARTLEMLSQVVDTELASHIKGRLPLLEAKVITSFSGLSFLDGMPLISIFGSAGYGELWECYCSHCR